MLSSIKCSGLNSCKCDQCTKKTQPRNVIISQLFGGALNVRKGDNHRYIQPDVVKRMTPEETTEDLKRLLFEGDTDAALKLDNRKWKPSSTEERFWHAIANKEWTPIDDMEEHGDGFPNTIYLCSAVERLIDNNKDGTNLIEFLIARKPNVLKTLPLILARGLSSWTAVSVSCGKALLSVSPFVKDALPEIVERFNYNAEDEPQIIQLLKEFPKESSKLLSIKFEKIVKNNPDQCGFTKFLTEHFPNVLASQLEFLINGLEHRDHSVRNWSGEALLAAGPSAVTAIPAVVREVAADRYYAAKHFYEFLKVHRNQWEVILQTLNSDLEVKKASTELQMFVASIAHNSIASFEGAIRFLSNQNFVYEPALENIRETDIDAQQLVALLARITSEWDDASAGHQGQLLSFASHFISFIEPQSDTAFQIYKKALPYKNLRTLKAIRRSGVAENHINRAVLTQGLIDCLSSNHGIDTYSEALGILYVLEEHAAPAAPKLLELALETIDQVYYPIFPNPWENIVFVIEGLKASAISAIEESVKDINNSGAFWTKGKPKDEKTLQAIMFILLQIIKKDPEIIPSSTRKMLRRIARSKDVETQSKALHCIMELKSWSKDDVKLAISCLGSQSSKIRGLGVNTLMGMGSFAKSATRPLKKLLYDENDWVASSSRNALIAIEGAQSIAMLLPQLTSWSQGRDVAFALDRLGWVPTSIEDIAHYLVAKRSAKELISNNAAQDALIQDLASGEKPQIENALWALIGIGASWKINDMIACLNANDSVVLAESFLNSGHEELVEAAHEWARLRGYTIQAGAGAKPIKWGCM